MNIHPVPHGQLHRLLSDHRYALVAANDLDQLPPECAPHSTAAGVLQDSYELLPSLVELSEVAPAHRAELLQACLEPVGGTASVSVLLRSDADAQTLAAHLAHAQIARSLTGEKAWLRLHDPRVWLQLNRVLRADRLNALMGPVSRWTIFVNGQWCSQENTGSRAMEGSFDPTAWAALERIGVVNRVLARVKLEAKTVDDLLGMSLVLDELIQRAGRAYHINRLDDQVEFCLLGLSVHARFDEHPRVRDVLLHARQDPSAFDELLSQDEAFWQEVGRTLNMTGEAST